jgi:hypothetical protein
MSKKEKTPIELARAAYATAKEELSAAQGRKANIVAEEAKSSRIRGGGEEDAQHNLKLSVLDRELLELERDVFDAGVKLDNLLREEALASNDPDTRGADVHLAYRDSAGLLEEAQRLRGQASQLGEDCFSRGDDPQSILAQAASMVAMATQAEVLAAARLTHGVDSAARLSAKRTAAGEPRPRAFPQQQGENFRNWLARLRGTLEVPPAPNKDYVRLIAQARGVEDRLRAEMQQRALEAMAARERSKNDERARLEEYQRRAAATAAKNAEKNKEAMELAAEMERLASEHRRIHG